MGGGIGEKEQSERCLLMMMIRQRWSNNTSVRERKLLFKPIIILLSSCRNYLKETILDPSSLSSIISTFFHLIWCFYTVRKISLRKEDGKRKQHSNLNLCDGLWKLRWMDLLPLHTWTLFLLPFLSSSILQLFLSFSFPVGGQSWTVLSHHRCIWNEWTFMRNTKGTVTTGVLSRPFRWSLWNVCVCKLHERREIVRERDSNGKVRMENVRSWRNSLWQKLWWKGLSPPEGEDILSLKDLRSAWTNPIFFLFSLGVERWCVLLIFFLFFVCHIDTNCVQGETEKTPRQDSEG